MHRCINPKLSRSAIHRCLQRHGISARRSPRKRPSSPSKPTPRRLHPCRCQIPPAAQPPALLCRCRDRPRHTLGLLETLSRSPRPNRRRLPRSLPRQLPRSRPHHPDRQRLRVHRPLRHRQKGQTQRQTLGRSPLRHPVPNPRHHPQAHQTLPAQTNGMVERFNPPPRRASRPSAAEPNRPPPTLQRSHRARCRSPLLHRRLQSNTAEMPQLPRTRPGPGQSNGTQHENRDPLFGYVRALQNGLFIYPPVATAPAPPCRCAPSRAPG
jgi:hypothetical protein